MMDLRRCALLKWLLNSPETKSNRATAKRALLWTFLRPFQAYANWRGSIPTPFKTFRRRKNVVVGQLQLFVKPAGGHWVDGCPEPPTQP